METNTKHTAGPWEVGQYGNSFIVTAKERMYDVAVVRNIGNEDNEANARLIAASPELLEALQAFMALDKSFSTTCQHHLNEMAKTGPMARAVQLARAAISKATSQ